jgi:hypothetical protein
MFTNTEALPILHKLVYNLSFHKWTTPTVQTLLIGKVRANIFGKRGVTWSAQQVSMAANLRLPHLRHYFSIQLDRQFSLENVVAPGIGPGASGSVARNSDL